MEKPYNNKGQEAEDFAAAYLQNQGLRLLTRNFRTKMGEIDLIMQDSASNSLVFVEVRMRKNASFGGAAASVTRMKQIRVIRTAQYYLITHRYYAHLPCRFDVMALQREPLEIQWIKNAFEM